MITAVPTDEIRSAPDGSDQGVDPLTGTGVPGVAAVASGVAGAVADTAAGAVANPSPVAGAQGPAARPTAGSFHVQLENFDGPFDLLLQLISAQRMDITEIALHRVTDDFIAHIRALGSDWDLGQATEFLVVAATLLDLKAARLLPGGDVEDAADIALLESRDLLFARLLAYRAYQQVAALFAELSASALRRYPRAVTLEERYLNLLPEVAIGLTPQGFADLATEVFAPKPPQTEVSVAHIHSSPESVAEHTAAMVALLEAAGALTFTQLVADCTTTMQIVARFLGLLNLFRTAAVAFEQAEPLAMLTVTWTGEAAGDGRVPLAASTVADEEYA